MRRRALAAMAAYYLVTGAWPILHMRSFEAITGPKADRWLVHMVGALAAVNGAAIAVGLRRERIAPETVSLALGSALAFSAIDVVYVVRRRISPIYLGDAAVELALAALIAAGGQVSDQAD